MLSQSTQKSGHGCAGTTQQNTITPTTCSEETGPGAGCSVRAELQLRLQPSALCSWSHGRAPGTQRPGHAFLCGTKIFRELPSSLLLAGSPSESCQSIREKETILHPPEMMAIVFPFDKVCFVKEEQVLGFKWSKINFSLWRLPRKHTSTPRFAL